MAITDSAPDGSYRRSTLINNNTQFFNWRGRVVDMTLAPATPRFWPLACPVRPIQLRTGTMPANIFYMTIIYRWYLNRAKPYTTERQTLCPPNSPWL